MSALDRWRDFRRTQRAALLASNHPHAVPESEASASMTSVLADILPGTPSDDDADGDPGPDPDIDGQDEGRPYGQACRPLNRQSPFYLGFVGGIGVLTALLLWQTMGR